MKPFLPFLLLGCVLSLDSSSRAQIAFENTRIPAVAPALRAVLADGVQSAEKATDARDGERALGFLAHAYAKTGDFGTALSLVNRLKRPNFRASVLGRIGKVQSHFGRDAKGATATFEAAQTAALAIPGGGYDKNSELNSLARTRAEAGDFAGASRTAALIKGFGGEDVLENIAHVAAREGEMAPVETFAASAQPDKKSLAARWLYIARLNIGNAQTNAEVPPQVTGVQDKIACLLALQETLEEKDQRGQQLLDQALALVPRVQSDDTIDMSASVRSADTAHIAYRQLRAGRFDVALKTLATIESPDDVSSTFEEFARVLTRKKRLQEAIDLALSGSPSARAMMLGAIITEQNRNIRFADDKDKAALKNNLDIVVKGTLELFADAAKDSDLNWAKVAVVTGFARGGDFTRADELARTIALPRQKANAHAGIARAAIEAKDLERAKAQLVLVQSAAHEEAKPEECAQILAQSVSAICDPLLEIEEPGMGAIFGGLN